MAHSNPKNEANEKERLKILAMADNIHDFWSGFRLRKDEEAAQRIKVILFNMFLGALGKAANPAPDDVARQTTDLLNSTLRTLVNATDSAKVNLLISDIEDTTRHVYYDCTDFLERHDPNAKMSHTDIINLKPDFEMSTVTKYDTYMITTGTTRVKTFTNDQKEKVAKFITHYFFGTADTEINFTCDTSPGKVGLIFKNSDNAYTVMTPMNIADSAVSSFDSNIGKGKTKYVFPYDKQNSSVFTTKQSGLTPGISFSFINENYCEKKPYGFKFRITCGDVEQDFNFNEAYRQGASLNYLLAATILMNTAAADTTETIQKKLKSIPLQSGCMRFDALNNSMITKLKYMNSLFSIWKEIKRGGDHDQCYAALYLFKEGYNIVLVTIDRLCFLLAQLLGIPCILHYKDTFVLSKNNQTFTPPSAEDIERFKTEKRDKFIASYKTLYLILGNGVANLDTFNRSITDEHLARWAPKKPDANVGKFRALLKLQLDDIKAYITKIIAILSPVDPWKNEAGLAALPNDTERETEIRSMLTAFSNQGIDGMKLIEISQFLKDIGAAVPAFNIDTIYSIFNFDISTYNDVYSEYKISISTISKPIHRRKITIFNDVVKQYNKLITEICDEFFDSAVGNLQKDRHLMPNIMKKLNKTTVFDELKSGKAADISAIFDKYKLEFNDDLNAMDFNQKSVELYELAEYMLANKKAETIAAEAIKPFENNVIVTRSIAEKAFTAAQTFLTQQIASCLPPAEPRAAPCIQVAGYMQKGGARVDILKTINSTFIDICKVAAATINNIFSSSYKDYFRNWTIHNINRSILLNKFKIQDVNQTVDLLNSIITDSDEKVLLNDAAVFAASLTYLPIEERTGENRADVIELFSKLIKEIEDPTINTFTDLLLIHNKSVTDTYNVDCLTKLLDDLYFKWYTKMEELKNQNDLDNADYADIKAIIDFINVILFPYNNNPAGSGKEFKDIDALHPFNDNFKPAEYAKGADGKFTVRWIGRTPEYVLLSLVPKTLMVLTFINDIDSGSAGWNTPFFSKMILGEGSIPIAFVAEYKRGDSEDVGPQFNKLNLLKSLLNNTLISLTGTKLGRNVLKISSGGSRKTIKRGKGTRRQHKRGRGTRKQRNRRRKTIRK